MKSSIKEVRRLAAALGVAAALLAVTGCGSAVAGEPVPAGQAASEPTGSAEKTQESGFDECGLVEPDEAAEALGVDAMYVTGRSAGVPADGGSSHATCVYFPENMPGRLGMQLTTVTNTDPEQHFMPFAKNFENIETIPNLGDRAEAVAYKANGTPLHLVEVRTIVGDRGLHLLYMYEDNGAMPKADGAAAAVILTKALERLPDEVKILEGTPEGRCADFDLSSAAEVVGAELTTARSVLSDDGAMSCYFGGGGGNLKITLYTGSQWNVEPEDITHADIGDGARVLFTEARTMTAGIDVDEQYVSIAVTYDDPSKVTELRPADVELVRDIVDTISDGN